MPIFFREVIGVTTPEVLVTQKEILVARVEMTVCMHYWLIESPNGPTSVGTCKLCGIEREFRNSIQVSNWESEGNVQRHQARVQAGRRA